MKHLNFKISYDGESLKNHLMDVKDLAPSLLALGNLFENINSIINSDKSRTSLNIKATKEGSFEIDLILTSAGSFIDIFNKPEITGLATLFGIVFGVFESGKGLLWLIKKLKGGKPESITTLESGNVKLTLESEEFEVSSQVFECYKSYSVRKSIEEVIKPLKKDGIELLKIFKEEIIVEEVSKSEVKFFDTPEITEEEILESTHKAAYTITALSFKEENKWTLYDGSTTIKATITDEDFLKKIENSEISFSKGDILICDVKIRQTKSKDGLKNEYEVLRVIEHKSSNKQLQLF